MSLASIQRELAEALRRPASLKEDAASTKTAETIASGNDRLSPVEQVDIYREQFWYRHRDVLIEDFQSIEHALGEEPFLELARTYLAECPSVSFTLRDLGEHMVRFLETRAPYKDDPFLADLAKVEWAFVEAFDGPDAPAFDPSTIAGVPEEAWPNASIVLHPSMQRITLGHPAHDYRIAVKKGEEATRPEPRRCNVVVYRGGDLLHVLEVDDDATAMLDELAKGIALGEACERAAARSGTDLGVFQTKLAGWFSEWTSLGWIRAVKFAS